jgi:hypothetical protein
LLKVGTSADKRIKLTNREIRLELHNPHFSISHQ